MYANAKKIAATMLIAINSGYPNISLTESMSVAIFPAIAVIYPKTKTEGNKNQNLHNLEVFLRIFIISEKTKTQR